MKIILLALGALSTVQPLDNPIEFSYSYIYDTFFLANSHIFPPEKCSLSVNRFKKRPLPNLPEIMARDEAWIDKDFYGIQGQLYEFGRQNADKIFTDEWDFYTY